VINISEEEVFVKMKNEIAFKSTKIIHTAEYTILANGKIKVGNVFQAHGEFPPLARVGMEVAIPKKFDTVKWYGRGPFENYDDRKEAAFVGVYTSKVADQHFPYIMPQENGNKSEVRWLEVNSLKSSLRIEGVPFLNFTVHDYSPESLNLSKTTHELVRGDKTYLNIDFRQQGLGGDDSWSSRVHKEYLLNERIYKFSFIINCL
jgi:beta-galactosidase